MDKSESEFEFVKKVYKNIKIFSNIDVIFSKLISSSIFDNIYHMFTNIIEHELKYTS